MKDAAFQKMLDNLSTAKEKYNKLLELAEIEYSTRYGCLPHEHDNDAWIDVYHIPSSRGRMTVRGVHDSARVYKAPNLTD